MGKILGFGSRRGRAAGGHGRRLSRDLFSVIVIGLGLGLGLAWTDNGPARALSLVQDMSARLQQTQTAAQDFARDGTDLDPVSSIGTKSSKNATYPVCTSRIRRNCVVDGDTFYFGAEKIRLADIDTPETHPPRCALEADLGDRATTRLSQLLSAGPFELARFYRDTDRYGRKLRVAMRDGRSLGDILVSEGLARSWTGRREPWCPTSDDGFG